MNFGAPNWFWALLAIPIATVLFVRAERRAARRLNEFVSARLLPALAKTVDRRRRKLRFALVLLGCALAVTALAKPRWGYIYEDVKRKGLDLICAVDTSRSMLSNDVPPSRLQRVKLALQDLLNELQGDRVGLIAFAGRAFLQAPLTIDYSAAVEAINDLDTSTIPEGGTNISAAIELAVQTYGKSAIGNRALIVFTDGEELSGDAVKAAKAAADAGVRIFSVGVGTPEGSLIPLNGERGGTNFVKDNSGQVVKSKLDEKRLKEIAEATEGSYFHLEDGPRTMKQLFNEGLSKMQAGDIDERMSRRPIERYQWPLGAAFVVFAASFLIRERRRERIRRASAAGVGPRRAVTTAALFLLSALSSFGAAPGLDAYRNENYTEAYQQFEKTLQEHPNSHAADRIEFDAGTAAYKMGDYNKALEWFSRSLLSKDKFLQQKSHYNIGRTLEERADKAQTNEKAIGELQNAQSHYEEALKLDSNDARAKANLEEVKRKIERLKQNPKKPSPPPQQPPPKNDKDKKDKDQQQQKDQQKDEQQKNQQKKDQKQDQQQKDQSGSDQQEKKDENKGKEKSGKDKEEPKPGESPSPSPGDQQRESQPGSSPSPSADKGSGGDKKNEKEQPKNGEPDASPSASPSPDQSPAESPSPSPGSGEGEEPGNSPSPSPDSSPGKKLSGEVKAAGDDKPKENPAEAQAAQMEPEKEGQMSEKQAQMLLQSMKDEEQRVQLDERKAARHVYKDW